MLKSLPAEIGYEITYAFSAIQTSIVSFSTSSFATGSFLIWSYGTIALKAQFPVGGAGLTFGKRCFLTTERTPSAPISRSKSQLLPFTVVTFTFSDDVQSIFSTRASITISTPDFLATSASPLCKCIRCTTHHGTPIFCCTSGVIFV